MVEVNQNEKQNGLLVGAKGAKNKKIWNKTFLQK